MAKRESRPKRWAAACDEARSAYDDLESAWGAVQAALETLQEIQSEYEEWQGSLPENLQGSALAEKLENVVNLELDVDIDLASLENAISEAESVELPLGFGRD